jgi:hypothetical protein
MKAMGRSEQWAVSSGQEADSSSYCYCSFLDFGILRNLRIALIQRASGVS